MSTNNSSKKNIKFNAKNGRGINYILKKAYEALGNPLIINDITYKLLAHSDNPVNDDFLWNELINTRTFSHNTVNLFSEKGFINSVAESDVALLKDSDIKYDRINAKIYDKNKAHIANICIVACLRPFEERDYELASQICKSLSIELENSEFYHNHEKIFEESLINKLIDGEKINKSLLQNGLEELYSDLKSYLYVAVIDITKYEYTLTHLTYFRDLFKNTQAEFKYFIHLNNIIALISTDNDFLSMQKDMNKLNEFWIDNNIYVGISSSFQNLLELKDAYKEALNALNYGLSINLNNAHHVFEYNNYKLYHILGTIKAYQNIKDICHPTIFLIKEYDKKNNTSYYDILSTYLNVGRNSKMTSKTLDIKDNDLSKQLDKISEIFEIDWNNGDMILSIFMSIKVLEYYL